MKKFIYCLVAVFTFYTVASPALLTNASYENNLKFASEYNGFKLLYDYGNNSAFQLKDEIGNVYEYV